MSDLEAAANSVLDGAMEEIGAEFDPVDPLVDKINNIVGPLSTGFGVTTDGADFFGLEAPTCQHPALRD